MNNILKENFIWIKNYFFAFLKWLALGLIMGIIAGVIGAAFAHSIELVTHFRANHSHIIYFLPIGGLVITALYKLCKTSGISTNDVFEGVKTERHVPFLLAPSVFLGTVITHLLGGSAGREGAALQLGGSIAGFIGKAFRLKENARHILLMCGMGAFFSALFGTPIGAFVFAIEVVSVGSFCSAALFPGIVSSLTAYFVAGMLNVKPERFLVSAIPKVSVLVVLKVVLIAVLGATLSIVFCKALHIFEKVFKKYFNNEYLSIFVGGCIIIILSLLFGKDYTGGGIDVINRIFEEGAVKPEAFLLKILFTSVTLAAGFKGGEIVPTIFIGATLGGTVSTILGLDIAFGAAVSVAALFAGVTNCPLATIFLCLELFGPEGIIFFALSSVISFLLSGSCSLYAGQRLEFSKVD